MKTHISIIVCTLFAVGCESNTNYQPPAQQPIVQQQPVYQPTPVVVQQSNTGDVLTAGVAGAAIGYIAGQAPATVASVTPTTAYKAPVASVMPSTSYKVQSTPTSAYKAPMPYSSSPKVTTSFKSK